MTFASVVFCGTSFATDLEDPVGRARQAAKRIKDFRSLKVVASNFLASAKPKAKKQAAKGGTEGGGEEAKDGEDEP